MLSSQKMPKLQRFVTLGGVTGKGNTLLLSGQKMLRVLEMMMTTSVLGALDYLKKR